jgi:hypothetical protein
MSPNRELVSNGNEIGRASPASDLWATALLLLGATEMGELQPHRCLTEF